MSLNKIDNDLFELVKTAIDDENQILVTKESGTLDVNCKGKCNAVSTVVSLFMAAVTVAEKHNMSRKLFDFLYGCMSGDLKGKTLKECNDESK